MKLEIESVSNGYIITVPKDDYSEIERKYVVEENSDDYADNNLDELQALNNLVLQLQDFFSVINLKITP